MPRVLYEQHPHAAQPRATAKSAPSASDTSATNANRGGGRDAHAGTMRIAE